MWGTYDSSFETAGAQAFQQDVPSAEVRLLDGGHFVLDTRAADVARLAGEFLAGQARAAPGSGR